MTSPALTLPPLSQREKPETPSRTMQGEREPPSPVGAVCGQEPGWGSGDDPDQIYGILKAAAVDMDDPATPAFDKGFDAGST